MANGDGNVDDDNEDDAKVPPKHTKVLQILDIIRDCLQFNSAAETPFSYLYELEKIVSVIHRQKHKQLSIMDILKGNKLFRRDQWRAVNELVPNKDVKFH